MFESLALQGVGRGVFGMSQNPKSKGCRLRVWYLGFWVTGLGPEEIGSEDGVDGRGDEEDDKGVADLWMYPCGLIKPLQEPLQEDGKGSGFGVRGSGFGVRAEGWGRRAKGWGRRVTNREEGG